MASSQTNLKTVLGVKLRQDPAREVVFEVVDIPSDLAEFPPGSEAWRRESLHRHMHTELQSLEIAAQSLVDFPEAPWDMRLEHARQCWDEARHAALIKGQLIAHGGRVGEFPVINFDWGVACAVDTLTARLTLQNRTVEAGEMDLLKSLREAWRQAGDPEVAEIMDGILADEVHHVRFANAWLKREQKQNPRAMMQVAAAIHYIREVTRAFTPRSDAINRAGYAVESFARDDFAVNVEDRRLAGFSDDDLAILSSAA